jgi:hypothetical protein
MPKTKVLITVTAYPLPSRTYDELVCTAGVLEDGSWIRIYPVPFRFLEFSKYQWIELDLQKKAKDFRPESYSPIRPDLSDMRVVGSLDTRYNWEDRKKLCLKEVYTNMAELVSDSNEPKNKSLAAFRPSEVLDLIVEEDERDWKKEWMDQLAQLEMFTSGKDESKPREPIRKVPYKFKYHFKDDKGRESKMMIEDWEIGALYWNCLRDAEGNESVAVQKVKQKYFDDIALTKDVYLFLGTTAEGHRRRFLNPFVIVGVFYPPRITQTRLPL